MSQMEKVITSLVERKVPFHGPVESTIWNDTIEELVHSIGLLQSGWNELLYPMLGSLPGGPVEVTAADRLADPNPFDNGMDGSQIYMDMTALESDTLYYSSISERPYTIKEAFVVFQESIQSDIQDAREAAIFAGISEEQKERIGANIFYVNRASSPSSLHGETIWLRQAVEQLIADIFNEGTDADSPPNLALYPVEEGLQTRDNTLMEYLLSLIYYHDNSLGGSPYIPIHHVFADPALEGGLLPQLYSNMVKAVSVVDSDYAGGGWPGTVDHLEDELNQIRTMIKRLSGDALLWTSLPEDPWDSTELSLQDHMNRTGDGIPDEKNPHGVHADDLDGILTYLQNASEVPYTPSGGVLYLATATDVKEALELLDAELGVGSGSLAAEVAARIAADADLQTQIDDLFTDEIQHDGSGTNYMVGQTDAKLALEALDAQIKLNYDDIQTNLGSITTLQAEVTAHKTTDDPAHSGTVIEFISTTGEPLSSDNVSDALNEFHAAFLLSGVDIVGLEFDQDQISTSPWSRANDTEAFVYFVDGVTGDDADNLGGEIGDEFKTISRALDEIGAVVMFPVIINIAAGAYTECITINKKVVDNGSILLRGTGAGPANVTIDPGSTVMQPKGTKDTLSTSGAYTWPFEQIYTVEIDSEGGGPGGVDTFTWYRGPLEMATDVPIDDTGPMDLERGINLVWDTALNHTTDDVFTFKVHPESVDILTINNTINVHLDNFEVQNAVGDGLRIANGSKVVANRINVDSCNGNGIVVTDHSTLIMQAYDLSLNGVGLLATRNSHAQIAAGASAGGANTGAELAAYWHSGIDTCTAKPSGSGEDADATTHGIIVTGAGVACWTTSTTTTTSTSTTTTTTTV